MYWCPTHGADSDLSRPSESTCLVGPMCPTHSSQAPAKINIKETSKKSQHLRRLRNLRSLLGRICAEDYALHMDQPGIYLRHP